MRVGYAVLRFVTPIHVGRWTLYDSWDYVPSDAIYSALYALGVRGGFRVSSAYPMVADASDRLHLPAPLPATWRLQLLRGAAPEEAKAVKRLRYIPLECLKGGDVPKRRGDRWTCGGLELKDRPYGERLAVARNALSRVNQMAEPYRIAVFNPLVPYVVYYQGLDVSYLKLLGEVGVGGKRSSGLGKFEVVEVGEVDVGDSGSAALLMGVGRPVGYERALGEWAVRSWSCTWGAVGPASVLMDGGVVWGSFDFEDLGGGGCVKILRPLWLWIS
ncbi:type III-A CRISPR-associated RAMP protein Csm4 [Pyrobaculum neutrophilum]|nr:CRISPR-associated protein [Pyrobaculum neutrophilum]